MRQQTATGAAQARGGHTGRHSQRKACAGLQCSKYSQIQAEKPTDPEKKNTRAGTRPADQQKNRRSITQPEIRQAQEIQHS